MNIYYRSISSEWETPEALYNELNAEFQFSLDPCSTDDNHKCAKYFTKEDDGLSKTWEGETVWMNPPYGREIKQWIEKAHREARDNGVTVVCLIPARTDTSYWHDIIFPNAEVRFLKGRVKFINKLLPSYRKDGNFKVNGAPFPSAIVIFD